MEITSWYLVACFFPLQYVQCFVVIPLVTNSYQLVQDFFHMFEVILTTRHSLIAVFFSRPDVMAMSAALVAASRPRCS